MCNLIIIISYYNSLYINYYIYIHYLFLYFTAKTFTEFIPGYNNTINNSFIQSNYNQINNYNNLNNINNNSFNSQNIPLNQSNYNQMNNYNNLSQQLNDEKIKNQKLESEIQKLTNELNASKQIQLQQTQTINSLTFQIQQLQNENQNLKLNQFNQMNMQNNQMNINEINRLNQIIMQKDNKIKELELQLQKNNKNKIYADDMMVVNFMSVDQSINTGIACTAENTLAEVEEKLYQMYNEYRNTNNILMHKGNIALRFKKIKENKIKNGDKIIIDIPQ